MTDRTVGDLLATFVQAADPELAADLRAAASYDAEEEFFSTYAKNYAEPEVVWLSRIIAEGGFPMSPDSIARRVLAAGYLRPGRVAHPARKEANR